MKENSKEIPPPPEEGRVQDDDTHSRREFLKKTGISATLLALMGWADNAEAKRYRPCETMKDMRLEPIVIPELGIHSQPLDLQNLPPEIRRVKFFYTLPAGCKPCDKLLAKIEPYADAASLRDSITVVCFELDPKGGLEALRTDPGYDYARAKLQKYYEVFVRKGGIPGLYIDASDRGKSVRDVDVGVPQVVEVNHNTTRVVRRKKAGDLSRLNGHELWKYLSG